MKLNVPEMIMNYVLKKGLIGEFDNITMGVNDDNRHISISIDRLVLKVDKDPSIKALEVVTNGQTPTTGKTV